MKPELRSTALAATVAIAALVMAPAVGAQSMSDPRSFDATSMGAGLTTGTEQVKYDDWRNRIQPSWFQYQSELQRAFPRLSEIDLSAANGSRSQVLAMIQERYNLSNERADERLTAWQRRAGANTRSASF